jgi:hypothetical protein
MKNTMHTPMKKRNPRKKDAGFALVSAIIACLILTALALLVISVSTSDLKTSSDVMGNKRAMYATESGIHRLTQNFEPAGTNYNLSSTWTDVDAVNDPGSQYRYTSSAASLLPPVPLAGYSVEAGQGWGMARYNIEVEGRNTRYNSEMKVAIGVGYGPVPISTIYR